MNTNGISMWMVSVLLVVVSRKHLWTYVAGQQENILRSDGGHNDCPCYTGSTQQPPSAVGNNYFL